jgi:hypothetical protein
MYLIDYKHKLHTILFFTIASQNEEEGKRRKLRIMDISQREFMYSFIDSLFIQLAFIVRLLCFGSAQSSEDIIAKYQAKFVCSGNYLFT